MPDPVAIQSFIKRWQASGAAERANFPQFAVELCDLLDVPRPDPSTSDDSRNAYVFERAVPLPEGTVGRIDLYKRGGWPRVNLWGSKTIRFLRFLKQ